MENNLRLGSTIRRTVWQHHLLVLSFLSVRPYTWIQAININYNFWGSHFRELCNFNDFNHKIIQMFDNYLLSALMTYLIWHYVILVIFTLLQILEITTSIINTFLTYYNSSSNFNFILNLKNFWLLLFSYALQNSVPMLAIDYFSQSIFSA